MAPEKLAKRIEEAARKKRVRNSNNFKHNKKIGIIKDGVCVAFFEI